MVSNLKILHCIRKLWPGQENPEALTHTLTHRQRADILATMSSSPETDIVKDKLQQRNL